MLLLLLAAAPAPTASVPDMLTLILSVAAIALAVSAIVFGAVFFAIQRNEARNLTKCVQDLVSQAIRSEKGIDELSDRTMPLIDRLVQAQVSAARAQAGPEVEGLVNDMLQPVQATLADMEKRIGEAAKTDELREQMQIVESLRRRLSDVASAAGAAAASGDVGEVFTLRGKDAQWVLETLMRIHSEGGRTRVDEINPPSTAMPKGRYLRMGQSQGLFIAEGDEVVLTEFGARLATELPVWLQDGSLDDIAHVNIRPGFGFVSIGWK